MTLIDFTQPRIVLSLHPFAGNRWIVADQTKLAYYPPCDLDQAVRFMRAMAIQTEGVEIDEQSVDAARTVESMIGEVRESVLVSTAACSSPTGVEEGTKSRTDGWTGDAGVGDSSVTASVVTHEASPLLPERHLRVVR